MNWSLFASTFVLIFVMELPDKTALSILMLATRHQGFAVFLGAAAAFVIQCLVAVTFGSILGLLPDRWVQLASGIVFLFFAYRLWQESREKLQEHEANVDLSKIKDFKSALMSSFVMIFIAEWGDLTQIATATLQGKYEQPLPILLGSISALWSVAALSVTAGKALKKCLQPKKVQLFGALIFASVGIYFLVTFARTFGFSSP